MAQTIQGLQNFHNELNGLKSEVRTLRSLLISFIGQDKEGRYHPRFVKEVLKAARQKPKFVFHDTRSFLAELRRV